jgi:hypothetical protein
MSVRPPISVRRPARPADPADGAPTPVAQAPIPDIDPDAAATVAFSLRGRVSDTGPGGQRVVPPDPTAAGPLPAHAAERHTAGTAMTGTHEPHEAATAPDVAAADSGASAIGTELISVKLPPDAGRQLAAIADRRGSKRTLVAIEVLSGPLRALADAHRAGEFPELPKIISGTVRSSIAFALPPDLHADLDYVLRARRAVRAQVVTRLLVPAIRALYEAEVIGHSR